MSDHSAAISPNATQLREQIRWGSIVSPDVEAAFRRSVWRQDSTSTLLGMGFLLVYAMAFVVADYQFFGFGGWFYWLLALRVVFAALCVLVMLSTRNPELLGRRCSFRERRNIPLNVEGTGEHRLRLGRRFCCLLRFRRGFQY